ncbi:MAG: hypothetical protein F4X81_16935 [Gammaproteobacteria bacterium]|nr:hypothetical protein [Gammaproteobacteria bacterium]MYH15394.1 hypothetical protein [Gammaproteobacteria bacterium]MYK81116.1 hypothetical protein [Gammaproteobacteria bacterium]
MPLDFGLDIGATPIGFAAIEHDVNQATGRIRRLGVRIFPEARDPKSVPPNRNRRQSRLRRGRQLADVLLPADRLPFKGSRD